MNKYESKSEDIGQSAKPVEALNQTEYSLRKNKIIDYILKNIVNKTD